MTTGMVPHNRSLEQMKVDVQELGRMYEHLMQVNTDYGVIPGTPKPTLYKPGAELLCLRFGYSPSFETDSSQCDFTKGFIYYRITCKLYAQSGVLVGCGMGSCNNYEPKYRYRWLWSNEVPADTDKAKMITRKKGNNPQYRIENPDPMELDNTILKMAMKRAHIAATLNATGASRIFTQDVEDMVVHDDNQERVSPPVSAQRPPVKAAISPGSVSPPGVARAATPNIIMNKEECLLAVGVWGWSEKDLGSYLKANGHGTWSSVKDWNQVFENIKAAQEPPKV
jgi:hypothetical protein